MKPKCSSLWDVCARSFIYTPAREALDQLFDVLHSARLTSESRILDTCAGTGYPALELIDWGYNVDCMDFSEDMIDFLKKEVEKIFTPSIKIIDQYIRRHRYKEIPDPEDVTIISKLRRPKIMKRSWHELPSNDLKEQYDILLCTGNSFIYAAGGWLEEEAPTKDESLEAYVDTLKRFRETLDAGGHLVIDKWKDTEQPGKHYAGYVYLDRIPYEIFFKVEHPEETVRRVHLIAEGDDDTTIYTHTSQTLSETEFEKLIQMAGFKNCRKFQHRHESYFTTYVAQK